MPPVWLAYARHVKKPSILRAFWRGARGGASFLPKLARDVVSVVDHVSPGASGKVSDW
ncbi:hypothetical protein ERY430_40643 [Erythrobacter sp. EC-HK427]|nr:hypothetical protein ERY430_40643 [Erythrobacter sp. EC-HK427]